MSHQINQIRSSSGNRTARLREYAQNGNSNFQAIGNPLSNGDGGFLPSAELQAGEEVTALAGLLVGLLAAYGGLLNVSDRGHLSGRGANGASSSSASTPSFGGGAGASGTVAGPSQTATPASTTKSGGGSGPVSEVGPKTGRLVDVPGGKMDASIGDNVKKMLNDAKKDGVDLQISSSYRSREEQERLYQAYLNGTGNLAAKPGSSNHESGLAIDFKNTSGAYDWLKKNAGRYGLKNLPSEPWHYSTNGK